MYMTGINNHKVIIKMVIRVTVYRSEYDILITIHTEINNDHKLITVRDIYGEIVLIKASKLTRINETRVDSRLLD